MTKPQIHVLRNKYTDKGWYYYHFTFVLGADYLINRIQYDKNNYSTFKKQVVRFVRVTDKGFNLLDLDTNKCIVYKRHLYDSRYHGSHIVVPQYQQVFHVKVPEWVPVPILLSAEVEEEM